MTLHDDRTFMRHFSWVLMALVAITIFFIFLSFLIVGETGVDSHSGYTYVKYVKTHSAGGGSGGASQQAYGGSSGGGQQGAATAGSAAVAANSSGSHQGAATAGSAAVASNSGGSSPNGKAIWKAHCSACHATGAGGAPKIGDKKEWKPILAKTNRATLYKHAINGFKGKRGMMPPKGGASSLSDAEVKAAVDYMVGKSGG